MEDVNKLLTYLLTNASLSDLKMKPLHTEI